MTDYTLITGASSGLGKDFALEYAKLGKNLILIARRLNLLEDLKTQIIEQYPVSVLIYQVDVSDLETLKVFLEELPKDIFIDRLINNAGFGIAGPFDDLDEQRMLEMTRVNIDAVNFLTYRLLKDMKQEKRGEILNVASMAAFIPGPYMAEYYATKAYVLSYSMALHEELRSYGIKVSALCPGPTRTEFFNTSKGLSGPVSTHFMMDSLPVVKKGMKDLHANVSISIPGVRNNLLAILVKIAPKTAAARIIAKVQRGDL